jgi:NADH:ubiquinone oxidoreductase subunit F (NADH-binding)/(2Fe-2S) ferredoxin
MIRLAHPGHLEDWRARLRDEAPAFRRTIVVTAGVCGRAARAEGLIEALGKETAHRGLEKIIGIRVTGCHGFCEMEPSVLIEPEGFFYGRLRPEDAAEIVGRTAASGRAISRLVYRDPVSGRACPRTQDIPFYRKQKKILTEAHFHLNPESLEDYVARGGYASLSKALFEMTSESVLAEIKMSGLRGRGGAGFPTGLKWEFGRRAEGRTKYVVCNADEGDPGAFMDRSLLHGNPHAVLEGMIIGAYAIGASEGFAFVCSEFPLASARLGRAIEQARERGLLGSSVLGSEFEFDVRVIPGGGAYVNGEETSLIAAIEGRKAFPRQRPPYPSVSGIGGHSTTINNVETWANVPLIIEKGADWYAGLGTSKSKGTKIFSLVGRVRNSGLVEVPMGVTLREIVEDIGGGALEGRTIKAVQTGGPAGGFLPVSMFHLPVDYESLVLAGSMIGSGGMIVLDDRTCIVDFVRYYLGFLRKESCGKCAPCRIGTRRMHELLGRMAEGTAEVKDLEELESLARTVKSASLCGLGQGAPNPVLSTLTHFRAEYEAHIRDKKCPAGVCRGFGPVAEARS